jgi:hypothetical protein
MNPRQLRPIHQQHRWCIQGSTAWSRRRRMSGAAREWEHADTLLNVRVTSQASLFLGILSWYGSCRPNKPCATQQRTAFNVLLQHALLPFSALPLPLAAHSTSLQHQCITHSHTPSSRFYRGVRRRNRIGWQGSCAKVVCVPGSHCTSFSSTISLECTKRQRDAADPTPTPQQPDAQTCLFLPGN